MVSLYLNLTHPFSIEVIPPAVELISLWFRVQVLGIGIQVQSTVEIDPTSLGKGSTRPPRDRLPGTDPSTGGITNPRWPPQVMSLISKFEEAHG